MLRRLAMMTLLATTAFSAAAAAPLPWNPSASTILVRTDRGGLFGRIGHRHEIRAQSFTGTINFDPASPAAMQLSLVISAASLKVVDHDLEPADVAKVQKDMESKVLEVEKYPEIRFTSTELTTQGDAGGAETKLTVRGTLDLHGVSKPISAPVVVTLEEGGRVHLKGTALVKQTDFGIDPISVGLGAVTVKNEVKIELDLIADAGGTGEAEGLDAPQSAEPTPAPAESTGTR